MNKAATLPSEAKVLRNLHADANSKNPAKDKDLVHNVGIPKVHWLAIENDFNVMVMDMLGPSLADLFNFCGKKFTMKTVLMVADQMI